jgi:hypothetical protein
MRQEAVVIEGDASCDGAKLYADGRLQLTLRANATQERTVVADSFSAEWGDEHAGDTLVRAGERRCRAMLKLTRGKHQIRVVGGKGPALVVALEVTEYNEVRVSLAKSRIRAI